MRLKFSVLVEKDVRIRLTINIRCWEYEYYNEDNLKALLRLIILKELKSSNLDERVQNYNAVLINIMNTLTFTKYVHKKLMHLNRYK